MSKRDAIVAAAKDLLWERGYEAMSPRDVMERSGAGQGSLYHHFPGKLHLAVAALTEMAAEEIVELDTIFHPAVPPLDRIARYLRRERAALRGCRLARLANEAAIAEPAFRAPVADFLDRIADRLQASLAEAQAAGQLRPELSAAAVATTLLAVIEGGYVLARTHWEPERLARAVEGAGQLLAIATRA